MKHLWIYGLFILLLTACSKNASMPELEEKIVFDLNASSAVIHSSSNYSFQVILKSKMPASGIKVEVSAIQEMAGTTVLLQPLAINSTTTTTTISVQNLPQQKWVVVNVRVSSATTGTNTATQIFRIIYK